MLEIIDFLKFLEAYDIEIKDKEKELILKRNSDKYSIEINKDYIKIKIKT